MGAGASSSHQHSRASVSPQERYRVGSVIGEGAFGVVHVAHDTLSEDQRLVAIKYIRREQVDNYVKRELHHLCRARHPHIVRVHEIFLTADYLAICMEYCSGGNLHALLMNRRLKEERARRYFQQLILAVDYCHQQGISHRDLKLENTLLSSREPEALIKLCDFGLSKADDCYSLVKTKVGTPGYTAPEVLAGQSTYDGKRADVWSAGVLLYLMLFGKHPFAGPSGHNTNERMANATMSIRAGAFTFPSGTDVSQPALSIIRAMLVRDPQHRLSIAGVMQHPWFRHALPKDALTYNEKLLARCKPPVYTEEQLKDLIKEARFGN